MRVELVRVLLVVAFFSASVGFAEPSVSMKESWRTVYADSELHFTAAIDVDKPFSGKVNWRVAIKRATVARGEAQLAMPDAGASSVAIKSKLPDVKPGVVIDGTIEFSLVDGEGHVLADKAIPLIIFSRKCFEGDTRWFEDQKLLLFDPSGKTAEVLEDADIKFKEVRNLGLLSEEKNGTILIGAGTSLLDERGLEDALKEALGNGARILFISPGEGGLNLSRMFEAAERQSAFRMESSDLIRRLDKRLDASHWAMDGPSFSNGLQLTADRGDVLIGVSDKGGLPWVEMRHASGGRLILTTFTIIESWKQTPSAPHLFRAILENLVKDNTMNGDKEE